MKDHILVADIGGTHARFQLSDRQGNLLPDSQKTLLVADHPSVTSALELFLKDHSPTGNASGIGAMALCAAGPVVGEGRSASIQMTNCPWDIRAADLEAFLAPNALMMLVNDFTAQALSISYLGDTDLSAIGSSAEPQRPAPRTAKAVLGPGTGLGTSGLIWEGSHWVPLSGEGGHVDLAALTDEEYEILKVLKATHAHISAELVLCGPGLLELYRVLQIVRGQTGTDFDTPAALVAAARQGDELARATLTQFTAWLGSVAGNLALILGATSGVYLAGGILPQWGPLFDPETFQRRFTAKGRFEAYLSAIPVWMVTAPNPALRGLASEAARRLKAAQPR